jgi:hypothetical protein
MRPALACVTVMAVLASAGIGAAGNLLTNPGFEPRGESGRAENWRHAGGASTVVQAVLAHSGQCAAKVRFDDRFFQDVPVEGGGGDLCRPV